MHNSPSAKTLSQGLVKVFGIVLTCLLAASLSSCSGSRSRATCFDCDKEPSRWSQFGFDKLEGTWKGTQAFSQSAVDEKRTRESALPTEVTFLSGKKFLRAYKLETAACGEFPAESVVLLNELWWDRGEKAASNERAFEVFGKGEKDTVIFGRAHVVRGAQGNTCQFTVNSKAIAMNRLALPAVAFTRRLTPNGRALASGNTAEVDVQLEFLNFDGSIRGKEHRFSGKKEKEAPLFFRFVKTKRNIQDSFDSGEWASTEEKVFRLWRTD